MGDVKQAINDGLSAVKSEIVDFVAGITHSRSTLCKLREAEPRVAFHRVANQCTVKIATEQTAMFRYHAWYNSTFCGTEDDESHRRSQSQVL